MPEIPTDKGLSTQRRGRRKLGDFAGRIRMSADFDDWPPDLQGALGVAEPSAGEREGATPGKRRR